MAADEPGREELTAAVLGRFALGAALWLVPALLLLPVLLLLVALSVVAGEGMLLAPAAKLRGGVLTALGPLLVLSGAAAIVLASDADADLEGWLLVSLFAALVMGGGFYAIRRALSRIARELRAERR